MEFTAIVIIMFMVNIGLLTVLLHRLKARQYEKLTESFRIAFFKEANAVGAHGFVNVTSKIHGLSNVSVPFGFEGVQTAPAMTLTLHKLIVDQAEEQGYKVNYIVSYKGMNKD